MAAAAHDAVCQLLGMRCPHDLLGFFFGNRMKLINTAGVDFLRTIAEHDFTHDRVVTMVEFLPATARPKGNAAGKINDLLGFGQSQVIPAVTQPAINISHPPNHGAQEGDFSQLRERDIKVNQAMLVLTVQP